MNISKILKKYPCSVNQIKFNIFSPTYRTEKINDEKVMFENEFFRVKLTGYKLSQLHRDILDIALYEGDNSIEKMVKEPIVARTFTLYHMQKKLKQNKEIKRIIENDEKRETKKYNNNGWLERKIKELKRATINIEIKLDHKKKIWLEFNIIRVAAMLNGGDNNPRNKKFFIAFTKEYLTFLESDILIDYRNYLDDLLKLKTGQSKALARYIISFKNDFSEPLENIMEKIGIGRNKFSRKTFNQHRNRILADSEELKKLNIEIIKIKKGEYVVRYKKLDNINFFFNEKEKRIIPSSPAEFLLPYLS